MMLYKFNRILLPILMAFAIISCSSDDNDIPNDPLPTGDFAEGMFILNEGGYGYSNASVSFLDETDVVSHNIFSSINNKGLGDVAQSMGFYEDKAYIVVNNSSTIEVVDRYSFESIASVETQISNPRYIEFYGNKGFISNWGDPNDTTDDYIAVLNLETNTVEAKISVAEGPEKVMIHNGKIYVTHKGGYGYGNTISVIDAASQSFTRSIPVGDVPEAMQINNGKLYVLCSGKPDYTMDETLGGLYKVDLSSYNVEASLAFNEGDHPSHLEMQDNALYYTMEKDVYKLNLSEFSLPNTPVFSTTASGVQILYGFKIENEKIYVADAKDYASNGEVLIYDLIGNLQQRFGVKIIPNSFYFNN